MDVSKVGVLVESFRLGLYGGIDAAHELGLRGLQIHVGVGEAMPGKLSVDDRKKLRSYLDERGITVSSFCGDLGGHGLADAKANPEKIEEHKRQMDLAVALNCNTITTHIGVIPAERAHPRYGVLLDAMRKIGEYSRGCGVRFAIETGPESSGVLLYFLEEVGMPDAVGVNLDPANLVMVTGDDPVCAVRRLKDYIFHTHIKDGKMLSYLGAERVYGFFADGGIEDLRMEDCFLETPLGEGSVDFAAYFAALNEIGYKGWHAIEREVGGDPAGDIRKAVDYLRSL